MDDRISERLRQTTASRAEQAASHTQSSGDAQPAGKKNQTKSGRKQNDGGKAALKSKTRRSIREGEPRKPKRRDDENIDLKEWQREAKHSDRKTRRDTAKEKKRIDSLGTPGESLTDEPVTEEKLEENEELNNELELGRERKQRFRSRVASIVLIVACAYLIALIFGVFMTDYTYNDEGLVAPEVLTVQDRQARAAFNEIQSMYEQCRLLYQETLVLDYRVEQGIENVMKIAPEYEALLDEVTNLSVKTEAMSVETQYTVIQGMLLTWIQDDIAVYLQNMSAGLSQNNEETLGNALVDAARVYNDFSIITQNILALGEGLNGVDLTEAREWSPEGYIEDYINGEK